jgi:hypothetical protein
MKFESVRAFFGNSIDVTVACRPHVDCILLTFFPRLEARIDVSPQLEENFFNLHRAGVFESFNVPQAQVGSFLNEIGV